MHYKKNDCKMICFFVAMMLLWHRKVSMVLHNFELEVRMLMQYFGTMQYRLKSYWEAFV